MCEVSRRVKPAVLRYGSFSPLRFIVCPARTAVVVLIMDYAFDDYTLHSIFPKDSRIPSDGSSPTFQLQNCRALLLSTAGLEELHRRIDKRGHAPSTTLLGHSEADRDARLMAIWSRDGRLHLDHSHGLSQLPLLARRFRCVSLIGEGTFAQILRAEDTFDPYRRHLAIKVLNRTFGELGRREAACLTALRHESILVGSNADDRASGDGSGDAMGARGRSGSKEPNNQANSPLLLPSCGLTALGLPVIQVHCTFRFLGHMCIAMDLASCSLLDAAFGGVPLSLYGRPLWPAVAEGVALYPRQRLPVEHCEYPHHQRSPTTQPRETLAALQPVQLLPDDLHTPVEALRFVALELVVALNCLARRGIVHGDIKPENVLLMEPQRRPSASQSHSWHKNVPLSSIEPFGTHGDRRSSARPNENGSCMSSSAALASHDATHHAAFLARAFEPPFRVALADFGNAIHGPSEGHLYHQSFDIQTLAYRAPEVMLGVEGSTSSGRMDVWSVGVMLAELYLGVPLFRSDDKVQVMQDLQRALGPLPLKPYATEGKFYEELVGQRHCSGIDACDENETSDEEFTDDNGDAKSCSNVDGDSGARWEDQQRRCRGRTFERTDQGRRHLLRVQRLLRTRARPADPDLVSFLAGFLALDPKRRLTPTQALQHPFLQPIFPFSAVTAPPNVDSSLFNTSTSSGVKSYFPAAEVETDSRVSEPAAPRAAGWVGCGTSMSAIPSSSRSPHSHSLWTPLETGRGKIKLASRRERQRTKAGQEDPCNAPGVPSPTADDKNDSRGGSFTDKAYIVGTKRHNFTFVRSNSRPARTTTVGSKAVSSFFSSNSSASSSSAMLCSSSISGARPISQSTGRMAQDCIQEAAAVSDEDVVSSVGAGELVKVRPPRKASAAARGLNYADDTRNGLNFSPLPVSPLPPSHTKKQRISSKREEEAAGHDDTMATDTADSVLEVPPAQTQHLSYSRSEHSQSNGKTANRGKRKFLLVRGLAAGSSNRGNDESAVLPLMSSDSSPSPLHTRRKICLVSRRSAR